MRPHALEIETSDGRAGQAAEHEASLDPQDWDAFRALCHAMVDRALGPVEHVRDNPLWRPVPQSVRQALAEPLPLEAQGAETAAADFVRLIMPYTTGNMHPRFFGWVHGAGTPAGMLAEFLAATMNANVGGRDHGAVYVERQVIDWCRQVFQFPASASGLLVSGTSMATLIGLAVARNTMAEGNAREEGMAAGGPRLVGYASQQVHGSVGKAFELLGLGRRSLRPVAVDGRMRLRPDALRQAIAEDRRQGHRPFAVIGTAGTVNTGAVDPLAEIAAICKEEGLWMHVDGAFGALAKLSPGLRSLVSGMELADSLAFDFHKWMHVPYDAGCILVRRGDLHRATFSHGQDYLAAAQRGLAGGEPWFCDFGPELSRGFRALKVWFTIKSHGLRRIARNIEKNCELAATLARRVQETPALQLMAPTDLNIVCFRYVGGLNAPADLDRVNDEIVVALHERAIAAPSTTRLGGALAIRACIANHRSSRADIDELLQSTLRIGGECERRLRGRLTPD